jgi:hypothetical protein
VVFFWGMVRENGEVAAGLSFRADSLGKPAARKAA